MEVIIMTTPKYPTLTSKGFLSKRGHDLDPELINIVNNIIKKLPHGLPLDAKTRGDYARDIYMQRCEGQKPPILKTPTHMFDELSIREVLYNATAKGPLRIITRPNPNDADNPHVYLERYPIFETPELLCYIHHFRMSDEPHIHNHPWRMSNSIILAGEYTEIRPKDLTSMELTQTKRTAGSMGSLTFDDLHRVKLPMCETGEKSVWTLFMHYRHWEQGWGFVEEKPFKHQVWDDLINGGEGGLKTVDAYPFVPKEIGANPKDWWHLPNGETRFIGNAQKLRERFGLHKHTYL
tara:strand:+ start:38309 stop:39187 length:879 start_codon:yes stop_codon:yes gene_type:complete